MRRWLMLLAALITAPFALVLAAITGGLMLLGMMWFVSLQEADARPWTWLVKLYEFTMWMITRWMWLVTGQKIS